MLFMFEINLVIEILDQIDEALQRIHRRFDL